MGLDPHFKAMLDAQAAAALQAGPPLTAIPPEMVRAGYRAQRTAQNVNTTVASVVARDLEVGGGAVRRAARFQHAGGTPPRRPACWCTSMAAAS